MLTTLLLAALSIFVLWGAAHATAYSLLGEATRSSLERCYRRCEKNNPPIPSPEPTQSPRPQPCDVIQTDAHGGRVTKTYEVGDERMLCFDVSGDGTALVEVATTNAGNASCALMWMTCTAPDGQERHNYATQPGCVFLRQRGRFYVWTKLGDLSNPVAACKTFTFTVAK